MTVSDFERLFAYSHWANQRLIAAMAPLTDEQFTQNVAGSYGSLRNTLVHMMSAEWGWIDRCGGAKRGPALKADDYPTLDAVTSRWKDVESHVRAFLATLTDADLDRVVEFQLPGVNARALPVGALLQHSANHSAHHRGQIAMLLRTLGCVPGNVDLVIYDAERAQ
jgi:uncharacterized damage-inducible protein DinB